MRVINQGNPSLKFRMDSYLRAGMDQHFLLHAICNRLPPFATRAVWHGEKPHFWRYYPYFYGFLGGKTTLRRQRN